MDLQTMVDNSIATARAEKMKTSVQLTLVELVLKLEAVDKNLPIYFDDEKYRPTGLGSWRGSYCELAIQYEDGGEPCYDEMKEDCERDDFGDHHYKCHCGGSKENETTLIENPKVKDLLKVIKLSIGRYYVGYKGGDFTMGKTTPIWIANTGNSKGFKTNENYYSQAVIDIKQKKDKVIIKTDLLEY